MTRISSAEHKKHIKIVSKHGTKGWCRMKCPKCKGEGQIIKKEKGTIGYIARLGICDKCHGSGEVEMTEQEYIQTCNTEQLAEKLWELYNAGKDDAKNYDTFEYFIDKEDVVEWLKEIHHG